MKAIHFRVALKMVIGGPENYCSLKVDNYGKITSPTISLLFNPKQQYTVDQIKQALLDQHGLKLRSIVNGDRSYEPAEWYNRYTKNNAPVPLNDDTFLYIEAIDVTIKSTIWGEIALSAEFYDTPYDIKQKIQRHLKDQGIEVRIHDMRLSFFHDRSTFGRDPDTNQGSDQKNTIWHKNQNSHDLLLTFSKHAPAHRIEFAVSSGEQKTGKLVSTPIDISLHPHKLYTFKQLREELLNQRNLKLLEFTQGTNHVSTTAPEDTELPPLKQSGQSLVVAPIHMKVTFNGVDYTLTVPFNITAADFKTQLQQHLKTFGIDIEPAHMGLTCKVGTINIWHHPLTKKGEDDFQAFYCLANFQDLHLEDCKGVHRFYLDAQHNFWIDLLSETQEYTFNNLSTLVKDKYGVCLESIAVAGSPGVIVYSSSSNKDQKINLSNSDAVSFKLLPLELVIAYKNAEQCDATINIKTQLGDEVQTIKEDIQQKTGLAHEQQHLKLSNNDISLGTGDSYDPEGDYVLIDFKMLSTNNNLTLNNRPVITEPKPETTPAEPAKSQAQPQKKQSPQPMSKQDKRNDIHTQRSQQTRDDTQKQQPKPETTIPTQESAMRNNPTSDKAQRKGHTFWVICTLGTSALSTGTALSVHNYILGKLPHLTNIQLLAAESCIPALAAGMVCAIILPVATAIQGNSDSKPQSILLQIGAGFILGFSLNAASSATAAALSTSFAISSFNTTMGINATVVFSASLLVYPAFSTPDDKYIS